MTQQIDVTNPTRQTLINQTKIVITLVTLLWILEIVDFGMQMMTGSYFLDGLGIVPRSIDSLDNILYAPWLHFGFQHLIANTIPFAVLSWLILLQGVSRFTKVTLISMFVGGLGIWLISPTQSISAGASILIFGYFGYLLFNGLFERSLRALSLMMIVVILYGSMIWGIFPGIPGISWQGHLFGFIGGALAAWFFRDRKSAEITDEDLLDSIRF